MLAIVPVKVIETSPVPVPMEKVSPAVPLRVNVPLTAERVIWTEPAPTSISLTEMALPFPVEKITATFVTVICAAGTECAGASLTAPTLSVTLLTPEDSAPALPELPWSFTDTPRVIALVSLSAVVYVRLDAVMNALMLAIDPVRVSAEALPPTVTPAPDTAASVPWATVKLAATLAPAESMSLKLMPVMALATSSVTPIEAGAVTPGYSLTRVLVAEIERLIGENVMAAEPIGGAPVSSDAALIALWQRLNSLQVESDCDLAHLNELEQRYPEAAKSKWTELRTSVGITAAQERLEELSKTAVDVENQIIAAPAAGLVGVAIKLTLGMILLGTDDGADDNEWPIPVFRAAQ